MSIEFPCPECQAPLKLADRMAGRRVRCPGCDELVQVPAAAATAPAALEELEELEAEGGLEELEELVAEDGLDASSLVEDDVALEPAPSPPAVAAAAAAAVQRAPVAAARGEARDDGYDDDGYDDDDYDDGDDEDEEASSGLGEKKPMQEGEMDMTPMVDVTFLLLIFFMVTAAFSLQKSIQIPKPEQTDEPSTTVAEEPEETPDIVTVQIDEYNTFTVLTADWEKEAAGEIDLIARLRESRQGNDAGVVPSQLLVKAHGKSLHYRVVMALDAGSETGFEDVQLMTVDGEF